MEKELIIAQWLMDNAAILLAEYETIKSEMDEYMYLKAVAHEALIHQIGVEDFEEAFDSHRIDLLIDFYFRREVGAEECH